MQIRVENRSKQNDTNEESLTGIIAQVRDLFEGELKAMVIDVIKKECIARKLKWQGNPITKIDHLAKAWADDDTLQEDLWHYRFGADEQAQHEGSN